MIKIKTISPNSNPDFFELTGSSTNSPITIQTRSFKTTINPSIKISEKFIFQKNPINQNSLSNTFNHSGFYKTNDFLAIIQNETILDFTCWTTSPEQKKHFPKQFRNFNCLNSKELTKNSIIQPSSISQKNSSKSQTNNINLKPKNQSKNIINHTSHNQLQINEIFPNPKGKDTQKEWIEIINNSSYNQQLKNLQIYKNNDKKPFIFINTNQILKPNQIAIIKPKKSIPNSNTTLKVFHNNQLIQQIHYESAPENQSFSMIENQFIWTEQITKNLPNPKSITLNSSEISNLNLKNQTIIFQTKSKNTQNTIKLTQSQENLPEVHALKQPHSNFTLKFLNHQNSNQLQTIKFQYKTEPKLKIKTLTPIYLDFIPIFFILLILIFITFPILKFFIYNQNKKTSN